MCIYLYGRNLYHNQSVFIVTNDKPDKIFYHYAAWTFEDKEYYFCLDERIVLEYGLIVCHYSHSKTGTFCWSNKTRKEFSFSYIEKRNIELFRKVKLEDIIFLIKKLEEFKTFKFKIFYNNSEDHENKCLMFLLNILNLAILNSNG